MSEREPGLFHPAEACIWMRAGLLSWKLCDRDFDCESCPLDAALTGASHAPEHHAEAASLAHLPLGRRYGRGHTWVEAQADGSLRLGLDAFASRVLGRPEGARLPAIGDELTDGAVTIATTEGDVPLAAPINGLVTRTNDRLRSDPGLLHDDPYGAGWLLELDPVGVWDERLAEPEEAERNLAFDLRHLKSRLAAMLLTPDVGPTLPDGGEPLTDLREILGRGAWLRLVRELLG